ncbi:hypothetical protein [Bradyrhizobium sp. NAS96.2]|uniref:hypothetical protein n=1 Tax=Bradyrhizobium sp. NAS96.2 TaxID=1680160 RepID=UPI001161257E|nr:hypothetical protein [Bradyrhizobium sp. NAS96.2]
MKTGPPSSWQLHGSGLRDGAACAADAGPDRRLDAEHLKYCSEINVSIVPSNVPDHIWFIERVAPGKPGASRMETTEMEINYLDTFLAFLGMTFGLVSVLPGLFFQPKVEVKRATRTAASRATNSRR